MGMIRVELMGSFRNKTTKTFSASEHGHADAVAMAIEFLASQVLPDAINQDHDLHTEGHRPSRSFGRDVPALGGA